MGKRKRSRSRDRDYDHIMRKLKKIASKSRKRRRSVSSSSSDGEPPYKRYYDYNREEFDDESYNMDYPGEEDYDSCENPEAAQSDSNSATAQRASSVLVVPLKPTVLTTPPTLAEPLAPPAPPAPPAPSTSTAAAEQPIANEEDTQNSPDNEIVPSLEPEILQLLGEDPTNQKNYGVNLHKDIAPRWAHILTNGLPKDTQLELAKRYLPPENCLNIRAPILNLEIKAALSEVNAKKDLYSQGKQNQLSSSLAAIGQVLTWALSSSNTVPQDIIKTLSDAGRLICDSHYKESQSRRFAALYTLDKSVRDTVKNTKIDEHLFGSALSEHIKSSKAIIKTGSEMKPTTLRPPYKPNTVGTQHQRGALNSRGAPPRVAAAAEPRPPPAPRRPPRDRRLQAPRGRRPTGYSRHQARRRY